MKKISPTEQKDRLVTEAYLDYKLEGLASKDDLKGFSTKDDLKGFATRDEFKSFATKDDLKGFATRDDFRRFATKDDIKGFATKDDLENGLKEVVNEVSELFYEKMNRIENTQDKILAKLETWEQENSVGVNQTRELRIQVDDHEKRINALEAAKN